MFDAPDFVVDWGVARIEGKRVDAYLVRLEAMIDRYAPDIIALPDPADYRKSALRRQLAAALVRRTSLRRLLIRLVSKDEIRRTFPAQSRTKYDRAVFLTSVLPDLREILPPPRKLWTSEDARMYVFDALCFTLATPEGEAFTADAANRTVY